MLTFLLTLVDESDQDKIVYLYNTYHKEMLRVARGVLKDRPDAACDAEDAVQEAFMKICKYINSIDFNADSYQIRAYVMAIVTNEAKNIMNIPADFLCFDEYEDMVFTDDEFLQQLINPDEYENVVKSIQKLDDKYSIILQMKYVYQFKNEQISDILKIPLNTVYTNLRRAKLLLLDSLIKEESL